MTDITPRRLVLWGVGTSRTVRAHWALHELDLDYECRAILPRTGETQTAEYTELNPRQKIPLLRDGDFKIAESPAIAAYLSNTYGTRENALIPTNPRELATWLEWCFYVATELDATSLYVMRRHGDLKHIYGKHRWRWKAPPHISRSNCIMPSRHCRMGDQSWSAGVLPPPTYCSRPA